MEVISTRQKNDVLFGTSDPLGASLSFQSDARRVSGYGKVSFLGISDVAFTIDVLEAGEDAEGNPGTFVVTQTLASVAAGPLQRVATRVSPFGSFMKIVVAGVDPATGMSVLSLRGEGVPVA